MRTLDAKMASTESYLTSIYTVVIIRQLPRHRWNEGRANNHISGKTKAERGWERGFLARENKIETYS